MNDQRQAVLRLTTLKLNHVCMRELELIKWSTGDSDRDVVGESNTLREVSVEVGFCHIDKPRAVQVLSSDTDNKNGYVCIESDAKCVVECIHGDGV